MTPAAQNIGPLQKPTRRAALSMMAAAASLGGVRGVASDRLSVVATTGMIADAARAVGGDLVEVRSLMGAGVDPHAFRPTRTDIAATARADLVLWNGLFLEAQMEDLLQDLSRRGRAVEVGARLPQDLLKEHDVYDGKFDPHIWMAPELWSLAVGVIASALSAARPDAQETVSANARRYRDEIATLQDYATASLASVPASARVLVTAHDAFGYFGRAYGFEVMGIQGISTESEAGLRRISDLVDEIVTRDIRAVFVETSVADRNIRALIEGAAARGHTVSIGGELYSDAMGPEGSYEGTYLGMVDHNVTTIANALGGTAPALGWRGKLTAKG